MVMMVMMICYCCNRDFDNFQSEVILTIFCLNPGRQTGMMCSLKTTSRVNLKTKLFRFDNICEDMKS